MLRILVTCCLLAAPPLASAHDTWVETNTNLVRVGDAVHVNLMLGNHGNDHRDFKIASKIDPEGCTLDVHAPDGKKYDLTGSLTDTGYAPKEGWWTSKFAGGKAGLYLVAHTLDRVVNHGRPVRAVKSAKTFFVLSKSLDRVPADNPGFDKPLGHPLELVPDANPVTPMGPGAPISVRLLHKGKPLAGTKVSFVPRGTALKEGLDEEYERLTDAEGRAEFTPRTGNYYLVVAHLAAPQEKTDEYDATLYAATLTVFVPEVCPCCGD